MDNSATATRVANLPLNGLPVTSANPILLTGISPKFAPNYEVSIYQVIAFAYEFNMVIVEIVSIFQASSLC